MILPDVLRASAVFAREWIGRPAAVGAICPSSQRLARRIAREVPAGDGVVIELGGGTGAVTQALLEQGVRPERLIVVERLPAFVTYLGERFPNVRIVHGDAAKLDRVIPPRLRVDAIVSGLPLRSLPRKETAAIVNQWFQVLAQDGVAIQFTYDLSHRIPWLAASGFVKRSSHLVWANLPPARIVTARKLQARNESVA